MIEPRNYTKSDSWKSLKRAAVFAISYSIMHAVLLFCLSRSTTDQPQDIAIVLGNRVYADGTLSPALRARTDKALALYRQKKVNRIFASGGINKDSVDHFPEGDAMRNYLVARGVPASAIVIDNYGANTYLTAKNFVAYNTLHPSKGAYVVSQFYHIPRACYILRKLGYRNVYAASADEYFWNDIIGTLREEIAIYKYMLVY